MFAMRLIAHKQPEWQRYYTWQLARVSVPKKALWRMISKLVNIIYGVLRNGDYDPKYVHESVSDEQYDLAVSLLKNDKKKGSKRMKLRSKVYNEGENNKDGAG